MSFTCNRLTFSSAFLRGPNVVLRGVLLAWLVDQVAVDEHRVAVHVTTVKFRT
jgi:hypothetical protein